MIKCGEINFLRGLHFFFLQLQFVPMEHHRLQNQVIFFNLFLPVSKKNKNRRKKNVRMLYIVVEFSSKPNLCSRSFILFDHVIYCIIKIATDCAEINPLLWKWFWWYCIAALTPLILWLQELMGQDFSVAQKQKLVFAGNNVSRFVGIWKEDLSFEHFQVLG